MEVYVRSRHEAYKQNANHLFKQAGKSGEARVKHCEGSATYKPRNAPLNSLTAGAPGTVPAEVYNTLDKKKKKKKRKIHL